MTEDEAKTKWCPFVRVRGDTVLAQGQEIGSWNRWDMSEAKNDTLAYQVGADMQVTRCIGSFCMAWKRQAAPMDGDRIKVTINAGEVVEPERHGYCGLMGAP